MHGPLIVISFILSLFLQPLCAENSPQEEVVIHVETESLEKSSSSSFVIIEKEELQGKASSLSLGDLLKTLAGFQVTTNFQGISTATLRGLSTGNILVYWNGIRLNK